MPNAVGPERNDQRVRFDRIELSNYRSFGPGKSVIELPGEENILAIVGANNAGKSNLLNAIRLALGSSRKDAGEPPDFHQLDITNEVRVELHMRTPLKHENIYRKTDEIHGFFFRAWRSDRGATKGQLKIENYCLDAKGETYRPPAALGKRTGPADPESEPIRFLPAPASRIASSLGQVNYLSPNMYKAFETSGRGVLAQLLDIYREDFRSAANTYETPNKKVMTRAEAFEKTADRMTEILRTEKLGEIEESLSENLQFVLGPGSAGAAVNIGLPTAEELLADILSLQVRDDAAAPTLSVDRLGDGYRSLLRLAILRTYADLAADAKPSVFLIEEPEAYLNPHLRRYLGTTLRKLAKMGNDVILTTHDAAFVSLPEYRTVMRVAKVGASSHTYRCTASLDFTYERIAQKLRRGGNAEVFFASKALLCEGQDDVAAARALLDHHDLDPDAASISLLDCGSRDSIPDYLRLMDELHIESLVITDGDKSKVKENDGTAKSVKRVAEAGAGRMFQFTEDIETALGPQKRARGENAAHLAALVEDLDLAALDQDHEIAQLDQTLTAFCSPPPETSGCSSGEPLPGRGGAADVTS